MRTLTMIKLGISALTALVAGGFFYQTELEAAGHARQLVAEGATVTAEVTGATTTSHKKYGFTTSKTAEVDYSFEAADGQVQSGRDDIEIAALEAMIDPEDTSLLRDDAAVEVLYMPANPADNGIKEQLMSHQQPDLLIVALVAGSASIFAFLALGRLDGFLATARARLSA